jgi:glutamine synthetase
MSVRDDYSSELVGRYPKKPEFENVEFIQIRYTDVPGRFLAKYIVSGSEDLYDCFANGIGVDGSSVKGFAGIDESDLLLIPDRSTLRLAPMSSYKVATAIADVHKGFGSGRLVKDPRYVSQSLEEHLAHEGLLCQVGPEVECFIFDDIIFNSEPEIISVEQHGKGKYPVRRKGGYDAPPFQDSLLEFRFEVADILKKYFYIKATNLNHEVASSGQIEINFMHSTLTKAADNVQLYKDVVRNVAKRHNKVANFMPKPIFDENDQRNGDNGSGMHASVSLWTKSSPGNNIFYDADDDYAELSQAGRYFIGGVLSHAPSLAALVAPTINSYRRMVPGFEAPAYIAWSRGNRSAVVRVPVNERGNSKSKRIEFRAPDPSANPYLAFSAVVAAGLDGIKKKIEPGNPVNENIYKMPDSARRSLGIKSLPGSLKESLEALKSDFDYLKPCFHGELLETYLKLKQLEIAEAGNGSKQRQFMLYYDA